MRSYNSAQTGQYGPADEVLLSEVRQGKLESFGVLYERYVAMARAIAYRHTSNRTLSEDLVSEAFVRILQALKNGKGPRAFMGGYLATTIAHLAAENGLIAQKEILSEEHDLESVGSLDETVLKLHESDELISAFTGLPERWQSVLWMTEVENKKPREVATALNLSANAVSALAARARESLREGFLRAHQHAPRTAECSQYSPHLSSMVRGSLTKKRSETLRAHLSTCSFCSSEYLNLIGINKTMRTWVFPVLAGLTPIVTDSSKVFLPYIAGGSAVTVGVSQGGGSSLAALVPGRWASNNPSLVGAAAVVTAIGAVAGGIALVNSSTPNSTVISADSQLEAAPAPAHAGEAGGISDTLVDSSQSQTSSMPADSFRAPGASPTNMVIDSETFDSETSSAGESNSTSSLGRAGSKDSASSSFEPNRATRESSSAGGSSDQSPSSPLSDSFQGGSSESDSINANSRVGEEGFVPSEQAADAGTITADAGAQVSPDAPSAPGGESLPVPQPVAPVDVPVVPDDAPANPTPAPADPGEVPPEAEELPVDRQMPDDPADPVNPTDPGTPVEPVEPGAPADPANPAEPVDPGTPAEPVDPVDPGAPAEPTDPAEPVDPGTPADPTDPTEPVNPADPVDPVNPGTPADPVNPAEPVDPGAPAEPTDPAEPVDPADPVDPANPADPADPVDPAEPVDPADPVDPVNPGTPADPVNPAEPVDPGTPANPGTPVDPAEPVNPAEPVDPGTPAEPGDPKDWVGTPEYYEWMAKVPWDTIGSPVNGNRMCTITYIYSDSLVSFGTYIPQMILDSPYVFYVLESYFELEEITQITCY